LYIFSTIILNFFYYLPIGAFNYGKGLILLSTNTSIQKHEICNFKFLRIINLFSTYFLYYSLYRITRSKIKAICIITNPLIIFFSCLFYTDVLSTATIIYVYLLSKNHIHNNSISSNLLLFSACIFSILLRQTNIIWLGLIAFERIYNYSNKLRDLIHGKYKFKYFFRNLILLVKQIIKAGYIFLLTLMLFVIFLVYNDFSIVVGDKSAHKPDLHFVQILYYFLFVLIFNLPTFIEHTLNLIKRTQFQLNYYTIFDLLKLKKLFILYAILPPVIYFFTRVHPYLLADNRHVVFYLWKHFLQYRIVQFGLIPVYIYIILTSFNLFRTKTWPIFYFYIFFTILSTCFQLLLEFRYFIIPNVFFQLYSNINTRYTIIWNFIISSVLLVIFVKKDVYWDDIEQVQMIMW